MKNISDLFKAMNLINQSRILDSEDEFNQLCAFAEDTGWTKIKDVPEGRHYATAIPEEYAKRMEKISGILPNNLVIPWPYEGYYKRKILGKTD